MFKPRRSVRQRALQVKWRVVFILMLVGCSLLAATGPAESAPSEWVAFGDSITVGIGASSTQTSFIGILEQRVGPIENQAVGATRLQDQLLIINAYSGNATHVIWLVGYNDMRAGTALDQFQTDLRSALDQLAAKQLTVYVGLCLPMTPEGYATFGPKWNHGSDAAVEALNEVIRATAASYSNVHLVDTALYDPSIGVSEDLVHPNDIGHRQIALAFQRRLALPIYLPFISYAHS